MAAACCVLTGGVWPCRKKAISRAGGIAPLAAVLAGQSAEGSMHAAQTLLHMAKLPDLKVGSEWVGRGASAEGTGRGLGKGARLIAAQLQGHVSKTQ